MKFVLLDRIINLTPGKSIETDKALTLAEEYLGDHFPTFPVMPGVMMLESLVQSASWLMRATTDFKHSMVVLAEARNVTYKSFVSPGRTLRLSVEAAEIGDHQWKIKGRGACEDREMVRAQFVMRQYNLAERNPAWSSVDAEMIVHARRTFSLLGGLACAERSV